MLYRVLNAIACLLAIVFIIWVALGLVVAFQNGILSNLGF